MVLRLGALPSHQRRPLRCRRLAPGPSARPLRGRGDHGRRPHPPVRLRDRRRSEGARGRVPARRRCRPRPSRLQAQPRPHGDERRHARCRHGDRPRTRGPNPGVVSGSTACGRWAGCRGNRSGRAAADRITGSPDPAAPGHANTGREHRGHLLLHLLSCPAALLGESRAHAQAAGGDHPVDVTGRPPTTRPRLPRLRPRARSSPTLDLPLRGDTPGGGRDGYSTAPARRTAILPTAWSSPPAATPCAGWGTPWPPAIPSACSPSSCPAPQTRPRRARSQATSDASKSGWPHAHQQRPSDVGLRRAEPVTGRIGGRRRRDSDDTFAYPSPPRPGGVFVVAGPLSDNGLLRLIEGLGLHISGVESCSGPERERAWRDSARARWTYRRSRPVSSRK